MIVRTIPDFGCPRHFNNGIVYTPKVITMKSFNEFTVTILLVSRVYIYALGGSGA